MNTISESTTNESVTDEELAEVSGGGFTWALFEGKTSSASTLGALETACSDLGGRFVVDGSAGGYSFRCMAR